VKERVRAATTHREQPRAWNLGENFGRQAACAASCDIVGNQQRRHKHPRFVEEIFSKQASNKSAARFDQYGCNALARQGTKRGLDGAASTKRHDRRAARSKRLDAA
jgi:hypothetical protein